MLTNFSYVRPKSLKEAVKQLSSEGAGLHAGGTDLLGCLRDHVFDIKKMVSISGLKDLRGIKKTADGGLRIGALTTIAEVAEHPIVKENYPALAQGSLEVASPQLRNQGTLGGNLCQKPRCWYYRGEFLCLKKGGERCFAVAGENQYHCIFGGGPCFIVHPSDTAPALVAFEASVRIAGPKGTRTVTAENFHVLPSLDVRRAGGAELLPQGAR
jgi:xanthine dehydrogenase YagS FAD-binding subunit